MRVAEQVRGVKGRHNFAALIIVKMAAELADRHFGLKQVVGGGRTEDDDHFWPE